MVYADPVLPAVSAKCRAARWLLWWQRKGSGGRQAIRRPSTNVHQLTRALEDHSLLKLQAEALETDNAKEAT